MGKFSKKVNQHRMEVDGLRSMLEGMAADSEVRLSSTAAELRQTQVLLAVERQLTEALSRGKENMEKDLAEIEEELEAKKEIAELEEDIVRQKKKSIKWKNWVFPGATAILLVAARAYTARTN